MRSPLATAAAALALVTVAWAQPPRQVIVAFGDSITEGSDPWDEEGLGGYPRRLERLLGRAGFEELEVRNFGRGGETTSEGVARLRPVLNAVADDEVLAVIVLEGTNDVPAILDGEISLETVVANLDRMGTLIRQAGFPRIYSTPIPRPPTARRDRNNEVTFELVVALRDLATDGDRPIAEPWERFFWTEDWASTLYYSGDDDPTGHPNGEGFWLLAETFADELLEDTVGPTLSAFEKSGGRRVVRKRNRLSAVVHRSGANLDDTSLFFTLDGRPTATVVAGDSRRAELFYEVTLDDVELLGCSTVVGLHLEDRAEPPNRRDLELGSYDVKGGGSCRDFRTGSSSGTSSTAD